MMYNRQEGTHGGMGTVEGGRVEGFYEALGPATLRWRSLWVGREVRSS